MPSDQGPPGNYPGNYPGGSGPAPGEPPRKQPGFFSQQRDSYSPREQEGRRSGSVDPAAQRRRSMRVLAAVVSLGFFAFIIWYSYQQGHLDGAESTPPLIKADVNPTRIRPDKPGGMEIPDQDKLVYNRVDPSTRNPNVERLLPPPEEPLAPSFPKTGQLNIPVPVLPQQLPPQFESATAPPPPVSPARQPRQLVPLPATPAQQAAAPAPPQSGFRVQLGAFRSEDAARTAWTRLQGRHKDLLAGMNATFQRADLGPKGVFFRLRAGPVASESAARNICSELAKRKAGCLVIRP